ncbi:aliphatic amidase regulator [Octadecabacter antarcticus 307]|uniref:Aliphatic amidase regulator n=1 Tax=Octadecabacter antarcticus 307 TaxID=391626 RepID=M9R5Y4_9RHOB|nr:aliphatic amidase regulator [Octadecabacter antarcticus 307]
MRRLRRMRILVIHPDDEERATLVAHLKRIGCQVDMVWPAPDSLPDYADVVLFLLGPNRDANTVSWMANAGDIARIAIISFETPEILNALERLHVHGVLSKPIRIFGVLAALTTAIGLARHEATLRTRVRSLDETLKARRKIEQAVALLSESKGIDEQSAYKRLRDKSQNSQRSIGEIADAIIAANDV